MNKLTTFVMGAALVAATLMRGQTIRVTGGNVGIGDEPGTERLLVQGSQRITGHLKFPSPSADVNDGRLGTALFASGLNIVGANTDATLRRLTVWGEIVQLENGGTNKWMGPSSFTGNVTVPAILDADNVGYYLNPNGTSRMNGVHADKVVAFSGSTGNSGVANSTGFLGSIELQSNGPGAAMIAFHRPGNYATYFGLDTDNRFKVGGWSAGAAANPVALMNVWNGRIYFDEGQGFVHATRFYDREDGSFVVDANGASRLHEVLVTSMMGTHVGYDSGRTGARAYEWGYQEGGPWSSPYPDLVFGYHTGLKFGANVGFGGSRFYADHPSMSTDMLFSVGNGDRHVRVTADLYVGGQVQATTVRSTSSRRWKDDIKPLGAALDLVRSLQGVTYTWKAGTALAGENDIVS